MALKCDMKPNCNQPIIDIDNQGYIYCSPCGVRRRSYGPVRKLSSSEIKKLEKGEVIKWDK